MRQYAGAGRFAGIFCILVSLAFLAGFASEHPFNGPFRAGDAEALQAGGETAGRLPAAPPGRIVSLVPSLTETLFALGIGDRLVGITDFCEHLPEARKIPSVGSCLEPSVEATAAKSPDLILYGPDQEQVARRLAALGLRTVSVKQIALDDIPAALMRIGEICKMSGAAASAALKLGNRLEAVAHAVEGRPRPRVLLVVGRDVSGGRIEQAYVAAPGAYHDDLLRAAGGENAWQGTALTAYPVVTQEGLMSLNPDAIIDLVPDPERQPGGLAGLKTAWANVPGIEAARAGRIYILTDTHLSIPGPDSAADAAECLARLLHPEAFP
ncbi:MAG TPA: helical backbone metal receptor [Candidatus Ozemobacteraceae bacterium]|nr:helical backbone metal receptor [Candidatus Ozemobacteraceae bacterium]